MMSLHGLVLLKICDIIKATPCCTPPKTTCMCCRSLQKAQHFETGSHKLQGNKRVSCCSAVLCVGSLPGLMVRGTGPTCSPSSGLCCAECHHDFQLLTEMTHLLTATRSGMSNVSCCETRLEIASVIHREM